MKTETRARESTQFPPQLHYRPAIDGLRAIAVIAVVVYHISPSWLPGGFLGVDVFFVISGFLIGSLLLQGIQAGTFSFREFYWRRFRRLAPALIIVLAATGLVALVVYSPNELTRISGYLLAAVFGVSNIRFTFENPYDAVEAGQNPLLHTWSLGVEEQFYLIIPLVLVVLGGWAHRRRLIGILVLAFVASFALVFVVPTLFSEQANFFLLPTRAWELLAGVILAAMRPAGFRLTHRTTGAAVSGLGLLMIGFSLVFLGSLSSGPGLWSVVPVVGTVLVIGAGDENPVSQALALRSVVAIGLISYPLYLWHFPLFAYWELLGGQHLSQKVALGGVAVVLAAATYQFIEKPIRRKGSTTKWVPAVFTGVIATATVASASMITAGLPMRVANMPVVDDAKRDNGAVVWTEGGIGEPVLLVGDSHMRNLIGPFASWAEDNNRTFASFTYPGCQLLLGIEKADRQSLEPDSRCSVERQQERFDWVNSFGPSTVVLGGRLPLVLSGERFNNQEGGNEGTYSEYFRLPGENSDIDRSADLVAQSYENTVTALLNAGHQVVLVYPIPEVGWHVPDELFRRTLLSGFTWPPTTPVTTSAQVFTERSGPAFDLLDSLSGPGITRVYPHELFCETDIPGRCTTHSIAEIYYEDKHHPSLQGARKIVAMITRLL